MRAFSNLARRHEALGEQLCAFVSLCEYFQFGCDYAASGLFIIGQRTDREARSRTVALDRFRIAVRLNCCESVGPSGERPV